MMVPISVSGLGLRDGVSLLVLQEYTIAGESVLAFSLLIFATTVFVVSLLGGYFEARRLLR